MENELIEVFIGEELLPRKILLPLWGKSISQNTFNHPEWIDIALQSCKGKKIGLKVVSSGEVIAYWPFQVRSGGVKEAWVKIIEPIGSEKTDYISPLLREGYSAKRSLVAMMEVLGKQLGPRTILILPKIFIPNEDRSALLNYFKSGTYLVQSSISPCSQMEFAESYQATEAVWSRKLRSDLRRQLRRLEELGSLSFYVAKSREDILERLPTLASMHREEWGMKGMPSEFNDPSCLQFYQSVVKQMPVDSIHYSEVHLDGKAISCNFSFINDGWICWYKTAYEMKYQKFSPSKVFVVMLLRWGIEKGLKGLDFLQGGEGYKDWWANRETDTETFVVAPSSAYPFWLWQIKYREKVRRIYFSGYQFISTRLKNIGK